jgi:hypothetical protein
MWALTNECPGGPVLNVERRQSPPFSRRTRIAIARSMRDAETRATPSMVANSRTMRPDPPVGVRNARSGALPDRTRERPIRVDQLEHVDGREIDLARDTLVPGDQRLAAHVQPVDRLERPGARGASIDRLWT